MKAKWLRGSVLATGVLLCGILGLESAFAGDVLFEDAFKGALGPGWHWVRERREAWRVTKHGLEVRIEPGNMWGPANDARNLLVRPIPDSARQTEIAVTFENHPTGQYEQADLVWYYDDGHMVKIGREVVDGKLSIVMGREEDHKARTIAIIPIHADSTRLKLIAAGNRIRGGYLLPGSADWKTAGECDLPAPPKAAPNASLQFYQGPAGSEHWVRVTDFVMRESK